MLKSLKVANYKNIGDSFIGFDRIEKFNILIGRNNIGKSTLLSILNQIGHISVSEPYEKKITMDVEFSIFLDNVPKNIFSTNISDGEVGNYYEYGETLLEKKITFEFSRMDNDYHIKSIDSHKYKPYGENELRATAHNLLSQLGHVSLHQFINQYKIIKLDADRNLLPETESTWYWSYKPYKDIFT